MSILEIMIRLILLRNYLINNMYKYILIAAGILLISTGVYSYNKGYNTAKQYYETALNTNYIQSLENIKQLLVEQDIREKNIVSSYIAEISLLKEEQQNEIESIKSTMLSNTVKCVSNSHTGSTGVSSQASPRSKSVCYTEAQLLRKVKESMAIAGECDQLAIKYNTLLSICK